ncbi:MATE efflux family protein [Neoconidiobolus thromboides FSU 785]|nr:MATE efflux family protein [Neoconidiobolus thromboides FSU 785]
MESTHLLQHEDSEANDITIPFKTKAIKNEFIYLLTSAIPIMLSMLIHFSIPIVNIYSVSQYGPIQVSAVALSSVIATTTGNSISLGMATALDTLCSQAFTGANSKHQVGIHLQRGIVIQMIMSIPIYLLWWNAKPILMFLRQDPELIELSAQFLRILILGSPPYIFFECLKKYLQAQKIMRAQTWVLIIAVPITLFVNYMLMWNPATKVGFLGAPLTVVVGNWLMFSLTLGYIFFIEGKECWGGWSKECLTNWKPYLKLGASGVLMLCSEWWAWSILSLTISYLGPNPLAAHYIALNIDAIVYAFPLGVGIATSNRIGNLLGARQINRAKLASLCSFYLGIAISCFNSTILGVFRKQISLIFAKEEKLNSILITLIPMICIYHVFGSIAYCGSGILRGQGKQKIGAIINIVSWYYFAIPIGMFMAFYLDYGLQGIWMGICIALFGTGSSLAYICLRSDWKSLILEAKVRVEVPE